MLVTLGTERVKPSVVSNVQFAVACIADVLKPWLVTFAKKR